MIPGRAVLGDLRSGNGSDRATDESAGFIPDKSARPGTESTANERTFFSRSAGGERGGNHYPEQEEA
jgi:hypothetical protein